MKTITIATFNCENLFKRFKFREGISQAKIDKGIQDGFIIDKNLFETVKEPERKLTAQAIKDTKADIIGLQEVENLDTLKSFQTEFIKQYPYQYLIDANDPRFIDVGALSKFEARALITHQFDKKGTSKIFSRDCFELEFDFSGVTFTLFINHFKAMLGGRDETMNRRKVQSERVVEIIKAKFGNDPGKENFAVIGDLNDYLPSKGLDPLLGQDWLENVIDRIADPNDRWTHWYDGAPKGEEYKQLDYILLSKRLAENSDAVPVIIRKGIAQKASLYAGARYVGVGKTRPAASDHCPVSMKLNIA